MALQALPNKELPGAFIPLIFKEIPEFSEQTDDAMEAAVEGSKAHRESEVGTETPLT
ncbi:hypothetical protein TMEN_4168 [Trichophyton mentagrophytes]|nr:hypothetical protein TMEN_4168 [Trichophyton mentagrophytes]